MKNFTVLAVLIFAINYSFAQCVPDTNITHNVPGFYPDTVTNLPHAHVGVAYATTIQFKVKADTLFLGTTVAIDSINVNGVNGLPPGFNFTCTPAGCSFPGGSDGCVYVYGPAPTAMGNYPITVAITAYGRPGGIPFSLNADITGYTIVIDTTTGIPGLDASHFSVGQNNPNPANEFTNITVNLPRNADVNLKVTNLIGKKVIDRSFNLNRGINNINLDLHGLPPGIYLYTVTEGKSIITRRMIVSND
jgi:hypothetical protein